MKDDNKTKKQLILELTELHSQNAALKKSITGSISAELAAEEARRYAESIVETVRDPLLVLDADLKIISANRNFYRTFKVTSAETIGSFIYDLGNKQWNIPKLRELLEEVLPEKEAFDDFEVSHTFQDIGHKIMLLNARQIYRKSIGAKMILLAIEDITEHRKLVEAHNNLAAIVESADDAIIGKDLEGIIVSWNRGAEIAYGYNAKEVIGKSISLLMPPGHPDEYKELLTKRSSGELIKNYETQRMRKDGKIVDVSLTISPVKDTSGEITGDSIIARDITEHKRLESLLEESEERYRRLFETASDGIVLLEKREGKITHANPAAEKMLGYTSKESIGNSLQDIGVSLDMGDFQTTTQHLNQSGIINYTDVPVTTKSGQHIDTDIYLVDRARLVQCNIRDITERKQAEERIHASLREKEILLKEVHHRVKNNMQVIIGILDLQASSSGNPELTGMLNESQSRIRSMALVHEKLYGSKDFARIDMAGYLRTLSQDLFQSHKINPGRIDLIIQTDGVHVDINKAIPCGLILNELISNALKHAFPEDRQGELQIIIREEQNTEIEIVVRDNGLSLPDNVDIHQPRTVGLHLVNGLVKNQLDGQMEVRRDNGTEFRIKFPL